MVSENEIYSYWNIYFFLKKNYFRFSLTSLVDVYSDLEKENAEIDESHISIKSKNYLNKTREEDLEYDFEFDPDLKKSKKESTQCLNTNSILNSTKKKRIF